jgi:class 3 adenylate cyclase/tetratricopeptide (TPR) repeat protein
VIACPRCGQENPDGFRFCGACGAELTAEPGSAGEVRKVVTVVFCDLAGYTSRGEGLDPEALRRLQSRYFEDARAALERHGATVEKFIGDAVMAVFGIPRVHEDDALRAVRAALELRQAVEELGLRARIGVNTGEVVAGSGDALVTGDAVNVAARLEQAAAPGEVLLGEGTEQLCRDAVRADPVEPLVLKGKAEPVAAFRLLELLDDAAAFERRLVAPMVGRENELAQVRACLDKAIAERRCRLVTAIGSPGIGKSRLAGEFVATLDDAGVLSGRCLPYGEGITYWPLVEIFREARAEEELAAALSSGAPEEISWSVRKSLERRAREQPLVLVVEDIHWAEPTLLDLIEHLVDWTRDAPLLLLCLARPELLDQRSGWDGGRPNAETMTLEPLTDQEAEELIETLLLGLEVDDEACARVRHVAGGNPLFVEQLVAMFAEGRDPAHIPPTIQALLSARLDGLPEAERDLLERSSVVGLEFGWEALGELASDRRKPSGALLSALVRKELIRRHEAIEDAFRFRHMLIRDAAYERIPKERRAGLHERLAGHLEGLEEAPEQEELIGYHLEQAYRYRAELGQRGAGELELGTRAAGYLGHAGLRAFGRSDMPATVGLLRRASALLPSGAPERLRLLPELAIALGETGRFDEAKSVLEEAVEEARHGGDRAAEGRARIEQLLLRLDDPEGVTKAEAAVPALVSLFEELGDDQALARVWRLYGYVVSLGFRNADAAAAMERVLEHARRAGDKREEGLALFWIPSLTVFGPVPAEEGIRRCEALLEEAAGSTSAEAGVRNGLSLLYAMVERAGEARTAMQESREQYHELGLEVLCGVVAMHEGPLGLYLGDPGAAESGLREAMEMLERLGERGYRSTAAVWLAQALNDQARYAEAEQATRLSEELASVDDMPSQVGWRSERARALARRGELHEAERLAREAVALSEPTDSLDFEGEAAFALAEVLRFAGRIDEAAEAAGQALAAWERKGIVGYVERARALLAELHAAT